MSKTCDKSLLALTNKRDDIVAFAQLFALLVDFILVSLNDHGILVNFAVGFSAEICDIVNLMKYGTMVYLVYCFARGCSSTPVPVAIEMLWLKISHF